MYVRSRFLARRGGVLELAMSIEACILSWLEGGCLSTPSTPPVSAPGSIHCGHLLQCKTLKSNPMHVQHDKGLAGKRTQFLVLVQAESCLANHLSSEEAFGNATLCQCDVLVLTFKRECNETSPAHIKYVFKPGTSWNEGRNFLYEVGKNRSEMYLYYIFTDDDIQLTTELSINPWRTFLDFLLDIEPAVGVVDFPQFLKLILRGKKRLGCGADINSTNYISAPNFDSAFNAFHYQAIDYILPYPTQFDKLSWWYSGYYSKSNVILCFPVKYWCSLKLSQLISSIEHIHERIPLIATTGIS